MRYKGRPVFLNGTPCSLSDSLFKIRIQRPTTISPTRPLMAVQRAFSNFRYRRGVVTRCLIFDLSEHFTHLSECRKSHEYARFYTYVSKFKDARDVLAVRNLKFRARNASRLSREKISRSSATLKNTRLQTRI